MSTRARLGQALRELRKSRNLTLNDVAKCTGLSISTLSKVERDQLSLTYDKLVQLAEGLEVDVTTFFTDAAPAAAKPAIARRSISRRNEGQLVETANYSHIYPNTDLLQRAFVPIVVEIRARTLDEFGPLVQHSGEEFTYVLEGSVVVHTEHYAPCTLEVGDSIHFDSNMGHAYLAAGEGPCRVLSICSASQGELMQPEADADRVTMKIA